MKHEISATSRLWLSEDTATLHVYNSTIKILMGWVSMIIGISVLVGYLIFKFNLIFVCGGIFLLLYGLLSLGYKQFVVIDPKRRTIKRESTILDFRFYSTSIFWDKNASFKYIISFNSLERFSFISLILYSEGKEKNKFIMNFPEARAFFSFKKLFNNKFPDFEITETHVSKVEFDAAEVHRKQIKSSHNRVLRHKDHLL